MSWCMSGWSCQKHRRLVRSPPRVRATLFAIDSPACAVHWPAVFLGQELLTYMAEQEKAFSGRQQGSHSSPVIMLRMSDSQRTHYLHAARAAGGCRQKRYWLWQRAESGHKFQSAHERTWALRRSTAVLCCPESRRTRPQRDVCKMTAGDLVLQDFPNDPEMAQKMQAAQNSFLQQSLEDASSSISTDVEDQSTADLRARSQGSPGNALAWQ